jgi:hypothetical protein
VLHCSWYGDHGHFDLCGPALYPVLGSIQLSPEEQSLVPWSLGIHTSLAWGGRSRLAGHFPNSHEEAGMVPSPFPKALLLKY